MNLLRMICFLLWSYLCLGWEVKSLEEKVGQLLMAHFQGDVANEEARELIEKAHIGGIVYYNWANGLSSLEQVRSLSRGLQEMAQQSSTKIPLLIAVDQEGGCISRLVSGFTQFPGNYALARGASPQEVEECAYFMGKQLRSAGITMNLAPVVDVQTNPKNRVIGVRSFGHDPFLVTALGGKMLQGYQRAEVLAVLKHFPGHGATEADSHETLPILNKTRDLLEQEDLVPFFALAPLADAVMTAHIKVPSLDEIAPATLSKKTLGLLRERGFQGVILADSLVMEGVLASCDGDVAKASIEALNAGCDLLLLGGKQLLGDRGSLELLAKDVCRAHGEIVRAVKEGRIPQSRIEESLARVLQLKSKYKEQGKPWVSPVEATALAEKVSASAVSIYKKGSFHLTEKKRLVWIPQEVSLFMDTLSLQGAEILFYPATVSSEEELKALDQKALLAEEIVFCSYNAWKYPVQQKLLAKLQCMGKPLAVFALRDPADVELCPQADAILATFSPTCLSLQAAYQRLLK